MKKKSLCGFVFAMMLVAMLESCSNLGTGITMRGGEAEDNPPARIESVAKVPADQSTYHYKVDIYPGLDEKFDPNPKLTLPEYNQISQLDWYCAKRVDELSGQFKEMMKQGALYGAFEGVFGSLGYLLGFGGNLIKPADYLTAIGFTAGGGGLASGKITFDMALAVAHGYCMTGMVYKADELEGKLRRIFVTPVYTGHAKLPQVSEASAPIYRRGQGEGVFVPPPAR